MPEDAMEMLHEADKADPRGGKRRAIMKQMHKEGKKENPVHEDTMGNAMEMRKSILMLSLFPNIYNMKAMLRRPDEAGYSFP